MLKESLIGAEEHLPGGRQGASAFSLVLEYLPCAVAIWTREQTLSVLNGRARQLTQCTEQDVRDVALWAQRVHPQDRARFRAAWTKLREGAERSMCDYRFWPKGRRQVCWVREEAIPYRNRQDEWDGWVSMYTEISDLRAPRVRRREGGEEPPGRLAELIDGFVHEMQNSLQGIGMGLDLVQLREADPLELQTVSQALERASRLLQEVREVFCPPELCLTLATPQQVCQEVVEQSRQRGGAAPAVRLQGPASEALSPVRLAWAQVRQSWARVLAVSLALVPQGGDLTVGVRLRAIDAQQYVEWRLEVQGRLPLALAEGAAWPPFGRLHGYRVGLSLEVVSQAVCRLGGKLRFRKKTPTHGVWTMLLKVPPEP